MTESNLLSRNLDHPILQPIFELDKEGKVAVKYGFNSGGVENHLFFLTQDGGVLGIDTVKTLLQEGEVDFTDESDRQWFIVGSQVHEEGEPLVDDHTGEDIPSLYGVPD